ncbi:MAG: hypothetical protein QOJ82_3774, partial [Solirubrobacteraceae bacterium]|nr:hypothetical protein [Solirubrobacteraceae bacterium]
MGGSESTGRGVQGYDAVDPWIAEHA